MESSCDKVYKLSLFNNCEVASGKFEPYIHRSESLLTTNLCDNPHRLNIVTCKDEKIEYFIKEVDGLDFDIEINSEIPKLPNHFPTVDKRSALNFQAPKSIEFIGLTLIDIIKTGFVFKAKTLQKAGDITLEENLLKGSLKGKKVILFLTGEDMLIETVWHKRDSIKFFQILSRMGFFAITGFNFSVFGGECAFSQHLNLKRSLFSSHLIEEHGMQAIPHVYVINDFQIQRWVKWFNSNPKVTCFAMNCQLIKENSEMHFLIKNLKRLLSLLKKDISVILQGFQCDYIPFLHPYIDRIHFTDKTAVKDANQKKKYELDIKNNRLIKIFQPHLTVEQIFKSNILNRKMLIEKKSSFKI